MLRMLFRPASAGTKRHRTDQLPAGLFQVLGAPRQPGRTSVTVAQRLDPPFLWRRTVSQAARKGVDNTSQTRPSKCDQTSRLTRDTDQGHCALQGPWHRVSSRPAIPADIQSWPALCQQDCHGQRTPTAAALLVFQASTGFSQCDSPVAMLDSSLQSCILLNAHAEGCRRTHSQDNELGNELSHQPISKLIRIRMNQ